MKVQNILKTLLKIVCLILVVSLGWAIYLGNAVYRYGTKNEMRTADAIVVLGAGTIHGKLSPVFQARIDHGIWLYDNGYGKKLILTGGTGSGDHEADSEAARRYAEAKLVSEQDILIDTKSRTTKGNIACAKQIAGREGLRSLILVSDPLHMKRAMLIARDYHLTAFASPTPNTPYIGLKSKLTFLTREIYYYTRYLIVREWQKIQD